MISRVTHYTNEKGHTVEALVDNGAILAKPHKFIGRAQGTFRTPQGAMQLPIVFDIEATTVEEAFEKYHEACMAKGQGMQDAIETQAARSRLAGRT